MKAMMILMWSIRKDRVRISIYILCLFLAFSSCKKKDRYLVISKIQSTAKLATTETTIDKVIVGFKERRWVGLVKVGTAEFVAYSKATIKSGIDLTELEPDDVKIDGNSISLELPHIKVLDFNYPFEKFEIDNDISDDDFLNRITVYDQEDFYRQAELDIRENLEYTGIVEATERKTRLMLTGMLKNMGYDAVFISFKKGKFLEQLKLNRGAEEEKDTKLSKKEKKENKG